MSTPGAQRDIDRAANPGPRLLTDDGDRLRGHQRPTATKACSLDFVYNTESGKWQLVASWPAGADTVIATQP